MFRFVSLVFWGLAIFFCASAQAYIEEEVQFPIGGGISLTGYVARPDVSGVQPALILQMGHGQGTTDSKTRKYNPFAQLARELADKGFIVLRFDKRGTGYNASNGSFADGTFFDYVSDLKAAVRSMQKRADVSPSQIFLMGHSLGGPVVSFVAKDIPEIKGIILSASPGRSFAEFNLEQMRYLYELGEGLQGEALEAELVKVKRSGDLIDQPDAFCREFPKDCEIKNGKAYLWGQSAEFWKEIAALDPLEPLRSLNCTIFAIHGTSDWVVSSANDGGAISAALSQNLKFSSKSLAGLDHFLLEVESKKASVDVFMSGLQDDKLGIHPEFIPQIESTLRGWVAL